MGGGLKTGNSTKVFEMNCSSNFGLDVLNFCQLKQVIVTPI